MVLYTYLFIGGVCVGGAKTRAPSALRRPPRAPLPLSCGRQVGGMSLRGGRALEPSTLQPWLGHTVRRRSAQAHKATAVMPSMVVGSAGCTTRLLGAAGLI